MALNNAFVGITGASGAPYAVRLIEALVENGVFVEICASAMGEKVLAYETGGLSTKKLAESYGVKRYAPDDLFAPPASGTSVPEATVVAPASVSTVGNIANGTGTNLIHRVADVVLKERKKLILVPRETPYSEIHLKNLLALTRMGALVLPASPSFYGKPKSVRELLDTVIGRLLDQLDLPHALTRRWGEPTQREKAR